MNFNFRSVFNFFSHRILICSFLWASVFLLREFFSLHCFLCSCYIVLIVAFEIFSVNPNLWNHFRVSILIVFLSMGHVFLFLVCQIIFERWVLQVMISDVDLDSAMLLLPKNVGTLFGQINDLLNSKPQLHLLCSLSLKWPVQALFEVPYVGSRPC